MSSAADILMKHLGIVGSINPEDMYQAFTQKIEPEIEPDGRRSELFEIPIEQLDLSVRVFNSLKRTGITTVGEVLEMLDRGPDAMLAIRNFGEKSLDELVDKLKEKNYLPQETEVRRGE